MSASSSPETIIDNAADRIEEEGGLTPFFRDVGIGGISMAIIYQLIEMITSAGGTILRPLQAFGRGLEGLVDATLGGVVDIIAAGFQNATYSLLNGVASYLGIGTAPLGVVTAMVSIYVFMWFVRRIEFSPLAFIGNLRGD